jgi:hypothetical protein
MELLPIEQLKQIIQIAIEETNGKLNDYQGGYKQCLIHIQNIIDDLYFKEEKNK